MKSFADEKAPKPDRAPPTAERAESKTRRNKDDDTPQAPDALDRAISAKLDAEFRADAQRSRARLGRLGEVSPQLARQVENSTGADIADTRVEERPELADEGKRAVAEGGSVIGVSSDKIVTDLETLAQGVHIVQQRGGSPARKDGGAGAVKESEPTKPLEGEGSAEAGAAGVSEAVDPEKEAQDGVAAVLGGEKFEVRAAGQPVMYEDEAAGAVEADAEAEQSAAGAVETASEGLQTGSQEGGAGVPLHGVPVVSPEGALSGAFAGAQAAENPAMAEFNAEAAVEHYNKAGRPTEWTKKLQTSLGLAPTGTFDTTSARAVAAFQSKYHLDVDGKTGSGTLEELAVHFPELRNPDLSAAFDVLAAVGYNSDQEFRIDWVRKLQMHLGVEPLSTAGDFDAATVEAIRNYQQQNGLDADGKITPLTRRVMEAEIDALREPLIGRYADEEPRLLVNNGSDKEKYEAYRAIIKEAGGHFKDRSGEINLLAIRGVYLEDGKLFQSASAAEFVEARENGQAHDHFSADKANPFDDIIVSLRKDVDEDGKETYLVRERAGTVDPNGLNTSEGEGTAHLRDGQYAYGVGTHGTRSPSHQEAIRGEVRVFPTKEEARRDGSGPVRAWVDGDKIRYTALNAQGGIEIWRELDASDDLALSGEEVHTSRRAVAHKEADHVEQNKIMINIHMSPNDMGASEGCQNVPVGSYLEFIEEIQESENSSSVLYTLIDASKVELHITKVEEQ